jgi:hypothetical protein
LQVSPKEASPEFALIWNGSNWNFYFHRVLRTLPDGKGVCRLARVLSSGVDGISSLALVADHAASEPGALSTAHPQELHASDTVERDEEVVDKKALAAYRRRLEEIDAEREEMREAGDSDGLSRLEEEREQILNAVREAAGMNGRVRRSGPAVRARKAASNSLTATLEAIRSVNPTAYAHMEPRLKRGAICHYNADAGEQWIVRIPPSAGHVRGKSKKKRASLRRK